MIDINDPEDPVAALKIYLFSYLNNVVSSKDPEKIRKLLEVQHGFLGNVSKICNLLYEYWGNVLGYKDDDEKIQIAAKSCLKVLLDDVKEYYDSFTE